MLYLHDRQKDTSLFVDWFVVYVNLIPISVYPSPFSDILYFLLSHK